MNKEIKGFGIFFAILAVLILPDLFPYFLTKLQNFDKITFLLDKHQVVVYYVLVAVWWYTCLHFRSRPGSKIHESFLMKFKISILSSVIIITPLFYIIKTETGAFSVGILLPIISIFILASPFVFMAVFSEKISGK